MAVAFTRCNVALATSGFNVTSRGSYSSKLIAIDRLGRLWRPRQPAARPTSPVVRLRLSSQLTVSGPVGFSIFAPGKSDNQFTRSDSLRTSFLELFVSELIDKIEGLLHRPAAVTPQDLSATPNRMLLIHGYSATGAEFQKWKDALGMAGIDTATIEIGNNISLNNEI